MQNILFVLIMLLVLALPVCAHHERILALVDTDAAPDDLRALCLLLAMDEVELVCITVSDGACSPEIGRRKVLALLHSLGREDIPVVAGSELEAAPPPWRAMCESIPWGDEQSVEEVDPAEEAVRLTQRILDSSETLTVFCFGPLTNIADALRHEPAFAKKIDSILWYNDEVNPPSGTNYDRDPVAADTVIHSGLPLYVFSNAGAQALAFDEALLARFEQIDSQCVAAIVKAHRHPAAQEALRTGHFKIWDELLPIYIRYPDLFEMQAIKGRRRLQVCNNFDPGEITSAYLQILAGKQEAQMTITFDQFPTDPSLFREDLRPFVQKIIARHGEEEWRICSITSEVHGHLGIYSIIGAKMGLRARELFDAGLDELEVTSFAGSDPPLSCFNDGLQVSTGATLGRGTITISSDPDLRPEAMFKREGRVIRMRLKRQYQEKVRTDLARGVELYGSGTPANWRYVRELGIRYWLEWDRNEIFEEVKQE